MNPWDLQPRPPLDYGTPRRPNVIPLHSTAPRSREGGANSLPAPPPVTTRRAIEARLTKPDLYETLRSAGYRVTLYDELAELWGEIRSAPTSHAIVGVAGFIFGTLLIVALAELIVVLS